MNQEQHTNDVRKLIIGMALGSLIGLIGACVISTYHAITDQKAKIELLEQKLADQRKINDELRSENELLTEENALRQLHEEILCSDAMQKPVTQSNTDFSYTLQQAVYRY